MKRIFRGFIPKDYDFFSNLLFSLVESDGQGLREYMKGYYDKDGQEFKVTILIEKIDRSGVRKEKRPKK